jgi:hypothetical protein
MCCCSENGSWLEFEFVEARQNWGEDRVVLHDEHGAVFSVPTGWTDAGAVDPFRGHRRGPLSVHDGRPTRAGGCD